MEYTHVPEEAMRPPNEYGLLKDRSALPENEYYGQTESLQETKRQGRSKTKMLKPIIAVISMLSITYASLGIDPVGIGSKPGSIYEGDAAFPILQNLEPDFDGKYAWSGYGSEEYVRIVESGSSEYTYLEIGKAWEFLGGSYGKADGAVYDPASNTLTLDNVSCDFIDVNLMGNSFTIKLIGNNTAGGISVWGAGYAGSLTISGEGKLTVLNDISFNAEYSQTCLMVGSELEVLGSITVSATSMEKAIYYLNPLKLTGGTRASGDFFDYRYPEVDDSGNFTGNYMNIKISEIPGKTRYYDYAVVDENGLPAKGISFTKE